MMGANQVDSNGAFLVVDKFLPLQWVENLLFFGALGSAFLYLLYFQLIKRQWYLRVRTFFFRSKPDSFAEIEGSDDDDGFVDGDASENLNPEHSVEQYRRQRFEAAAAAVKHSSVQEMYNLPMGAAPLRRRGNLA
ncbi:uncharacterized protein Dana_GF14568 [Drosophila ananassae]|uniref:Uncharacterized protein n=1 Tax=Drosophila ananassae TaxID=7217 RepID=B3MJR3_DROAN|nr:uncharacterized protein LOC6497390 [Drosophila ananassae]EDV31402.1 uncharacterized protein Dana_GF14568 [Drosophila ananassae]